MNLEKENTHLAGQAGQVLENENNRTTSNNSMLEMERAFLRGLFCLSARDVLEIASEIEERDFTGMPGWIIFTAITNCAQSLIDAGDEATNIDPTLTLAVLQADGEFTNAAVRSTLTNAVTGELLPIPRHGVKALAAAMRKNRVRRACTSYGENLIRVANNGSDEEITTVLAQTTALLQVANRAGLLVHEQLTARRESALRMPPLNDGRRDPLSPHPSDGPARRATYGKWGRS